LYYFNTNDGQGEVDVNKMMGELEVVEVDDEDCDGCTI
jgi:hypothetical protein